jgi:Putative restriction endonuclease
MSRTTTDMPTMPASPPPVPLLRAGDQLTRDEFERRYNAMPAHLKFELLEGVVYMASPVFADTHGSPHFHVISWLGVYEAATPGTQGLDNTSVRLEMAGEPQPDAILRVLPECGGQTSNDEGFVSGGPEFIAEIAASSASNDLGPKLRTYLRHGVREYVVWRVHDKVVDWFVIRQGTYELLPSTDIYKSECFPGLWLDWKALVAGDIAKVHNVLRQGLDSHDHATFVANLQTKLQAKG